MQIRGSNGTGNFFVVDGQNLMENTYNTLTYGIISDSIEETQVITGAISAEYGNVEGGVINTITKSGGNKFEGMFRMDFNNAGWDAVRPFEVRPDSMLNKYFTYTLGGFIIKDHLWFHVSYYTVDSSTQDSIPGRSYGSPDNGGAGALFNTDRSTTYGTYKLTYGINADHSLLLTYSQNESLVGLHNNGGYSGELDALEKQKSEQSFYNVSWRAVWSPNLSTEVRYGAKQQHLATGGFMGSDVPTIWDADLSLIFMNGLWDYNETDQRDNQTANAKGSYFLNWQGQHEIDFGVDWYKGITKSKNSQSPTNNIWVVFDWDREEQTGIPVELWHYEPTDAGAYQESLGLYVNDKWKVNRNLALQLGLRWDNYKAYADDYSGNAAASSGFSPRLGLTYDLFGDQQWIFKLSYCIYNGPVLENITSAVSGGGGNPIETDWEVKEEYQTYETAYNLAGIMDMSKYYIYDYSDPTLNVMLDPNLRPPNVTEWQLGAAYSFDSGKWGKGAVSLTYVNKEWKNLVDSTAGMNDMAYAEPLEEYFYIRYYTNVRDAVRKYKGLELVADYFKDGFHLSGNVTWSELKGNYDSESRGQPGAGAQIHWYDWVTQYRRDGEGQLVYDDDGRMIPMGNKYAYDWSARIPYGYLTGHRPITINVLADYTINSAAGRTVVGFKYRFLSGAHYSNTRNNVRASLQAANANYTRWRENDNGTTTVLYGTAPSPIPSAFGNTWTQYMDNERGAGVFNATAYHDLSVTHDLNLFKVAGYQVTLFAKVIVYNFFNHQQLVSWNTTYSAATSGEYDAPWVPAPATTNVTTGVRGGYGSTGAASYWGVARYATGSVGLRF
jgi:outer membrane receptor for ferrienterochelin and colicin